jgi:RimJ/RimL family protein N-acetyltransferase
MDDAALMLEWQSHPQTRRFARNPKAPDPETHHEWLRGVLRDPARILCILEAGDLPAGSLRLDPTDDGGLEISIYTAPDHYRRGIASAGLRLARQLAPGLQIHAHVLPNNSVSHELFTRAGYHLITADHYVQVPQ